MKKDELYRLIPFGIACVLVLTHIVQTKLRTAYVNEHGLDMTYLVVVGVKYGGFGLTIVLTLVLVQKELWKYAFTFVALLASISVIDFYSSRFLIKAGIVDIEVMSVAILIGHLVLNPEVFDPLKPLFRTIPVSEEMKRTRFEHSVKLVEAQFKNKPTEELEKIVEQNVLVSHAIEAAKRLLQHR